MRCEAEVNCNCWIGAEREGLTVLPYEVLAK